MMNAPDQAERFAARMAGHFGMLPGAETLALCERALNDWRNAADTALAARLAEIIGRDAA